MSKPLTQWDGLPETFRFQQAITSGVHHATLSRWVEQGLVERLARGVYRKAQATESGQDDLVIVAQKVPAGVFCLDSALYFHALGTRIPHQVMVAVERSAWLPKIGDVPLRAFRFSGKAFSEGIEEHIVQGVKLRVYGKAKTVADVFKYRNKLGLETALEALKSLVNEPGFRADELLGYCRICHVERTVTPYLEALL